LLAEWQFASKRLDQPSAIVDNNQNFRLSGSRWRNRPSQIVNQARLRRPINNLSMLAENSSFCWAKIPPPCGGDGLQFQPAGAKMKSAGEAEAGSAGVQPAKE
jgi:hypothetical protein